VKSLESIIEKFGENLLVFKSYYKYTFIYEGMTGDGVVISISVHEDENIYKAKHYPSQRVKDLLNTGECRVLMHVDGEQVLDANFE
jgi:hypothetical protein